MTSLVPKLSRSLEISSSSPDEDVGEGSFREQSEADEDVPVSLLELLSQTLESISKGAQGQLKSPWGLPEFFGLQKVLKLHKKLRDGGEHLGSIDGGVIVDSREELEELLHWLRWAMAAYEPTLTDLAHHLGVIATDIVAQVGENKKMTVGRPAYYIALDHARRALVLAVRGTWTYSDMLTDLNLHSEPLSTLGSDGHAHAGMLSAADWILRTEREHLRDALQQHPGYSLVLTGHSLGAGTAALMAYILRDALSPDGDVSRVPGVTELAIPPESVTCWAYECPPCVTMSLCQHATFITSVCLHDDMVPRLSAAAIEDLRDEMVHTSWEQLVKQGGKGERVLQLANSAFYSSRDFEVYNDRTLGEYLVMAKRGIRAAVAPAALAVADAQDGKHGRLADTLATGLVQSASFLGYRPSIEKFRDPWAHFRGDEASGSVISDAIAQGNKSESERSELVCSRLFTPGTLYHIRRESVEHGAKPPRTMNDLKYLTHKNEGTGIGAGGAGSGGLASGEGGGAEGDGAVGRVSEVKWWAEQSEQAKESEGELKAGSQAHSMGKGDMYEAASAASAAEGEAKGSPSLGESSSGGAADTLAGASAEMAVDSSEPTAAKLGRRNSQSGNANPPAGGEDDSEQLRRAGPKKEGGSRRHHLHEMLGLKGKEDKSNATPAAYVEAEQLLREDDSNGAGEGDARVEARKDGRHKSWIPAYVWKGKGEGIVAVEKKRKNSPPKPSRHVVVRGSHNGPRFKRLVLSNSVFSDHFCTPVAMGIIDAICWLPEDSKSSSPGIEVQDD
eukprot:jgi/Mesen1/8604/ME000005S08565